MNRNMSSPLGGLDDVRAQVSAEVESVALEPYRDFEFDLQTSRLRCAGYSTAEVADLLELYRDHLSKMQQFALAAQREMEAQQ